jgi:hypothetical protein
MEQQKNYLSQYQVFYYGTSIKLRRPLTNKNTRERNLFRVRRSRERMKGDRGETKDFRRMNIGEPTSEKPTSYDCFYEESHTSTNIKAVTSNRRAI